MGTALAHNQTVSKKNFFIIIHESVYEFLDHVSPQAERFYRILRSYSNSEYKPVFPKVKTVAARMQVSTDSVSRYLKELEKIGLLRIERNLKGNRNCYHFEFPDGKIAETEPAKSSEQYPQICGYNNQIQISKYNTPHPNPSPPKGEGLLEVKNNNNKQVVDEQFINEYCKWYLSQPNAKILNPAGWKKWLRKHVNQYDFSDYIAYQKRIEKRFQKNVIQPDKNYSSKYSEELKLLETYQKQYPEKYDRLKFECEEKQKRAPICTKSGTHFFGLSVKKLMITAIRHQPKPPLRSLE